MHLIQSLVPEELRRSIKHTDFDYGIRFIIGDDVEISIEVMREDITKLSPNDYYCTPIRTPYQGERQYMPLLSIKEKRTFGLIFPISSLRTGSEIKDPYHKQYAALAIHHLIFNGIANHLSVLNLLNLVSANISITELFPEDFALMILWKDLVLKENYTFDEIKLLIQSDAYSLYPDTTVKEIKATPKYDKNFNLPYLSPVIKSHAIELLSMISAAKREASTNGRFMAYYQVIEFFLAKVFQKCVALVIDETKNGYDPWSLRERLNEVAAEKWRLTRLEDKFLLGTTERKFLMECAEACNELLDQVVPLDAGELHKHSWSKSLYMTRNLFVHRAIELDKCPHESKLKVCDSLLSVCYEIIANFDDNVTITDI